MRDKICLIEPHLWIWYRKECMATKISMNELSSHDSDCTIALEYQQIGSYPVSGAIILMYHITGFSSWLLTNGRVMITLWIQQEENRNIYYVMQKHLCPFQNEKWSSFKLMGEWTTSKQTECLPQHIISFSLRCRQLPSAGVITETWAEAIVQLNSTTVACLHNTWNKCRHTAFTKPCY